MVQYIRPNPEKWNSMCEYRIVICKYFCIFIGYIYHRDSPDETAIFSDRSVTISPKYEKVKRNSTINELLLIDYMLTEMEKKFAVEFDFQSQNITLISYHLQLKHKRTKGFNAITYRHKLIRAHHVGHFLSNATEMRLEFGYNFLRKITYWIALTCNWSMSTNRACIFRWVFGSQGTNWSIFFTVSPTSIRKALI